MKIYIVSHNYPTEKQPYLQPFIRDQVQVISKMDGYEPQLLIPSPMLIPFTKRWSKSRSPLLDSHLAKRFSYLSIPRRFAPLFTGKNLARNLLNELPNDGSLVHIHWLYPNGITIPKLNRAGVKCILNIHGTDWHSTKDDPRFSSLIEDTLRSAHAIVVSGEEIEKEIIERIPGLNIYVSYNYIDTDLFKLPDNAMIRRSQKKLRFDPDKLNILTIANIRPEKGVDIYLDSIANISRTDICFHIVGQRGSGSFADEISKKLDSLPQGTVKFHSPVPRDQIPYYYYAADAYLLPSRSEGFNVSLLEALATGLYVIATDTGGAANVLGGGRGTLVEAGNSNSLAEELERFSVDDAPGRSEESRKFILDRYSMQHYSGFLHKLYSEIRAGL